MDAPRGERDLSVFKVRLSLPPFVLLAKDSLEAQYESCQGFSWLQGMVIQRPQSTRTPRKAVRSFRATVWISIYIFFAAFPLLVLLLGQTPKGGGFWWDFSMGLGFAGLSMMGLQFVLTARFRRATAPFGIDIIYYFHRWAAIGAVALVLIHYLILRVRYVDALGPANPASAPWYMSAGRLALLLFLVLIISSVWRKQLRIEYDRWRIWLPPTTRWRGPRK